MNEVDILYTAIHSIEKDIPVIYNWKTVDNKNDIGIDGELTLTVNNQKKQMMVEIKKDVKNHQMLNIIELNNQFENFLLVAEKLYPKVKKELRENNINYMEANGNIYINKENFFLYIDTNKTAQNQKEKGNRAFTKTGLKVVFHFLINTKLLNETQREIAERANVALGNIPLIINGLLENNFILKVNKNDYIINNYEELLNKWITEFEQTLKPTIFKKRFKFQNENYDWKTLKLDTNKTVWGGEPAGDIITNHLRPEIFTLYTKENAKDLMMNYRLLPDDEGNIWVYEKFWTTDFEDIAPKELVYADLMINADKRSIETAKLILNEYIQPNL